MTEEKSGKRLRFEDLKGVRSFKALWVVKEVRHSQGDEETIGGF